MLALTLTVSALGYAYRAETKDDDHDDKTASTSDEMGHVKEVWWKRGRGCRGPGHDEQKRRARAEAWVTVAIFTAALLSTRDEERWRRARRSRR